MNKKYLHVLGLLLFLIFIISSSSFAASEIKIPVITYHHIIKNDDILKNKQQANTSILPLGEFEKQMKYLHDNNFYVASLDELYNHLNGRITLPKKTVVITFDDGYLSNKVYAYPILKKYGFKADMFLIGNVLKYNISEFNPEKIQFLRLSQLESINDIFTFQNHTFNMHSADKKGHSLLIRSSYNDILNDLNSMKELFNTEFLAYPRGQNNQVAIKAIKDSGHKLAFTIKPGYVTSQSNPFKLPRFPISMQETPFSTFKSIVNGTYK